MLTRIKHCIPALILCFLLFCSYACAEDLRFTLQDGGLDLGIHSIHFPSFQDATPDSEGGLTSAVNALLAERIPARELTARLGAVMSSPVPLVSTWEGFIANNLLSVHLHASGPLHRELSDSEDYAVLVDLDALSIVPWQSFFMDPAKALQVIEEKLEWEIAPALSPHLINADIVPASDVFAADQWSFTLYYPSSRLMTLSGNAGQIRFFWYELQDILDTRPGSLADRLGIVSGYSLDKTSADEIRKCVEAGAFPSVPAAVGDALKPLVEKHPLLHDPDNIEGARIFALEGASMQDIFLLTDDLFVNSYENSIIEGIRADTMCLYGLCTGKTLQEEWRSTLGNPDASVILDSDAAELLRLDAGISDYYSFGHHTLRLHADENHILRSIIIQ